MTAFSDLRNDPKTPVQFGSLSVTWSPPALDQKRSERLGRPKFDKELFWGDIGAALAAEGIGTPQSMSLAHGGPEDRGKAMLAVYVPGGTIRAFHLEPSPGLAAWIEVLAGDMWSRAVELSKTSNGSSAGIFPGWTKAQENPVPWLLRSAPNDWEAQAQTPEKQRLLEAAAQIAGPDAVSDLTQIAPLWQRIVKADGVQANAGAGDADFAAFEAVTGFAMPEGLAALLRLSNGATGAFGQRDLLSVQQITDEWKSWKQIFDDFQIADLTDHHTSDADRTVAFYTTPFWVPFAGDRTGNFAAIDLLPGPQGHRGQVIQFGADEQLIRVIGGDIVEFLRQFAGSEPKPGLLGRLLNRR